MSKLKQFFSSIKSKYKKKQAPEKVDIGTTEYDEPEITVCEDQLEERPAGVN